MKIFCRGHSVIAEALEEIFIDVPSQDRYGECLKRRRVEVEYLPRLNDIGASPHPSEVDRLLICQGIQMQKPISKMLKKDWRKMFRVNYWEPVSLCEAVLEGNPKAKVVIIGSEAVFTGSYNLDYSASKAALHHYVEHRRVGEDQQLVCIAPTMIWESGMFNRRNEDGKEAALKRMESHPKLRWLWAEEVAKTVLHLFENPYITNTVIRVNGGEHAR